MRIKMQPDAIPEGKIQQRRVFLQYMLFNRQIDFRTFQQPLKGRKRFRIEAAQRQQTAETSSGPIGDSVCQFRHRRRLRPVYELTPKKRMNLIPFQAVLFHFNAFFKF